MEHFDQVYAVILGHREPYRHITQTSTRPRCQNLLYTLQLR